jgi:hypothetical protein
VIENQILWGLRAIHHFNHGMTVEHTTAFNTQFWKIHSQSTCDFPMIASIKRFEISGGVGIECVPEKFISAAFEPLCKMTVFPSGIENSVVTHNNVDVRAVGEPGEIFCHQQCGTTIDEMIEPVGGHSDAIFLGFEGAICVLRRASRGCQGEKY